MKRIKIMLLSFALLAIVGGALAFKAKLNAFEYCTTNVLIANQTASLFGTFTDDSGSKIYYTTPYVVLGQATCEKLNDAGDLTTVTATTSTTLIVD